MRILAIPIALALGAQAAPPSPTTKPLETPSVVLSVKALDISGRKPLEMVSVSVSQGGQQPTQQWTNPSGLAKFEGLLPLKSKVTTSRPGYISLPVERLLAPGENAIETTLIRSTGPVIYFQVAGKTTEELANRLPAAQKGEFFLHQWDLFSLLPDDAKSWLIPSMPAANEYLGHDPMFLEFSKKRPQP